MRKINNNNLFNKNTFRNNFFGIIKIFAKFSKMTKG